MGNEVVTAFTPVNAQAAIDAHKGRPGAAHYFRAVLSWLANQIPAAFAVTYLVGVIVAAWFLAQIGPRILGVDLAAECRTYEEKQSGEKKNSLWRGECSRFGPFA